MTFSRIRDANGVKITETRESHFTLTINIENSLAGDANRITAFSDLFACKGAIIIIIIIIELGKD